jgi:cytosine/adenosine deaminase-related metal-dependent hydrolase
LSPHAPYSTHWTIYNRIKQHWMPTATHLAEPRAELELLQQAHGPFVDFLKELGVWNPDGLAVDIDHGCLDTIPLRRNSLLIHCNYLAYASELLRHNYVVACPRTHAAFGHERHPLPAFLTVGVHAALGTDSLASNPDLDILAEARHLRQHYPEIAPATLLRMLTLNGAEALGFDAIAGSLTAGKSADLVVLPLPADSGDPHDLVLGTNLPVARTMFRGEWR